MGWTLVERELALVTPIRKLRDRNEVGAPGVPVADVGGEELDEALTRVGARRRDRGRQRFDAGAD